MLERSASTVYSFFRSVLALVGRFLFSLLSIFLKIVSFGRFDLAASDLSTSAPKHVWWLLWPYLVSTRPWPIAVPQTVGLPTVRFETCQSCSLRSIFWAPLAVLLAVVGLHWFAPELLASIFAFITPATDSFSFWGYLFSVNFLAPLAACIALHYGLNAVFGLVRIARLPVLRVRKTSVAMPFGGRTIVTLPVFCQAWLLVALIGFGCWLVNHIGLQSNGLNGSLMTALQKKDAVTFVAVLWQFAQIMAIMTVLGPVYSWVKQLIVIGWTKDATALVLDEYTDSGVRAYYAISLRKHPDNPNERIQQDLPAMCQLVMGFLFALLDAVITLYMFGGLLWDLEKTLSFAIPVGGYTVIIGHMMLTALVFYALIGTNGATVVGRRLIGLNAEQRKREAHFRVLMVMFEKYAEPIAAYHGEEREYEQLFRRFKYALANNYVIIRWRMMLGMFTGAYGKVAQFLPLLTLVPFYFSGQIELGAISQSSGACAEILGALSLIVSQFDSISMMFACSNRVGELRNEVKAIALDAKSNRQRIKRQERENVLLKIENMDLYSPGGEKLLVAGLNLDLQPGVSLLVRGASGSGKTSILRAVAGLPLWDYGCGSIAVAPHGRTMMLSQLAYTLSEGTLREQLLYPMAVDVSDDELVAKLKLVNLSTLLERFADESKKSVANWDVMSDSERNHYLLGLVPNWDSLSGGERQRLMVARALVNKVVLVLADEATSGLDIANEQLLYAAMKGHGITMLSVGHRPSLVPFHEYVIELLNDGHGGWRTMPASESQW
ncbi:MAG: SbmA/BacA-like family transporter [Candidatus Obscuribacterales bacterium]|nr:SbmA/BacA-like family transporter [Candidatus Obscuribacterales bacterium]